MKLSPEHLAYTREGNNRHNAKKRAAGYATTSVWLPVTVLECLHQYYPGTRIGIDWSAAADDLLRFKAKEGL